MMSKPNLTTLVIHSIIFFSTLLFTSCSSGIEVMSKQIDKAILIDGERSDWAGNLTQVDDGKAAFGFKNDEKSLYILFVTPDRASALKILMQGLTLWVKSEGGEELGIKYPMKPLPEDLREIRGAGNKKEQPELPNLVSALKRINDQIQVITKEDYPVYTSDASKGKYLRGSFGMNEGQFVIEMQIPLAGDDISQRLFATKPTNISLKFETGKFEMEGVRPGGGKGNDGGEGRPGGGGMGRNGGKGNHGETRPGGGERPNFEPLKYSFKVVLGRR